MFGTRLSGLARLSLCSPAWLDPLDLRLLRLRCALAAPDVQGVPGGAVQAADRRPDGGRAHLSSGLGLGVQIGFGIRGSGLGARGSKSGFGARDSGLRVPDGGSGLGSPTSDPRSANRPDQSLDCDCPLSDAAVLDALRAVRDPDLNRDIVILKFVKNLRIDGGRVSFTIELTTPACPVKDQMREQARAAVAAIPGVTAVTSR